MTKAVMKQSEKQITNRDDKPWLFKPGQSGNPKGRPPGGHSITEAVKALMDNQPEVRDAMVKQIVAMALNGDISTIRTLWAYMDGMPRQQTDITSGGQPLPILGGMTKEKETE